jgi:hypothetical protein
MYLLVHFSEYPSLVTTNIGDNGHPASVITRIYCAIYCIMYYNLLVFICCLALEYFAEVVNIESFMWMCGMEHTSVHFMRFLVLQFFFRCVGLSKPLPVRAGDSSVRSTDILTVYYCLTCVDAGLCSTRLSKMWPLTVYQQRHRDSFIFY